jgi:hypothetical protein
VPFLEAGLPRFADLGADLFDEARERVIAGGPSADPMLGGFFRALDMNRYTRHAAVLAGVRNTAVERMERGQALPWVALSLLLAAIADSEDDPDFDEEQAVSLMGALAADFEPLVDAPEVVAGLMSDLGSSREAPPVSRPLELGPVARELTAAFDPTVAASPVRRRVLATIEASEDDDDPQEPCPALAVPVWRALAGLAPDWLLPGVAGLRPDSVIAVATNPVFVDAFLTGLNTRAVEELRWRNLRLAAGCTPVRTFWLRTETAGGEPLDDITGILRWDPDTALGDAQHRPPGAAGADLVLVFRSSLFERYPETLLYLVSARHGGIVDFTRAPDDAAVRHLPTFQGRIGADVTFFGFVGVPAAEVRTVWVALEEAPSGFRFRNDVDDRDADDGATFADAAFDDQVRVLIRGTHLVPRQG